MGSLAVAILHAIQTHSWVLLLFILAIAILAVWWRKHLKNRMESGPITMEILKENGFKSLAELEWKIEQTQNGLQDFKKLRHDPDLNAEYELLQNKKTQLEEIKFEISTQRYK